MAKAAKAVKAKSGKSKPRIIANPAAFAKQAAQNWWTTGAIFEAPDFIWNQFYTFQRYATRDMIDAFYGFVYIAVSIIADTVASLPKKLFANENQEMDSNEDVIEVKKHPFWDVMRKPNPFFNAYDLYYITVVFLELTGNAYWYVTPNNLGVPATIEPLLPHRMIVRVMQGQLEYYYMPLGGQGMYLDPRRVIHFKYPSALTHFYGMSPIDACGYSVNLRRAAQEFDYDRLKNHNIPPFFLTQDVNISQIASFDKQAQEFKDQWERYQSGTRKHQPGILPAGMKPEQLEENTDSHAPQVSRDAMNEIMTVYRVPLLIAGMTEQQGLNKAVAETVEQSFLRHTIMPKTRRIEETIENRLLNGDDPIWYPGKGNYWLDLDFQFPDMRDKDFDLQASQALKDYLTVDEVRVKNGWEPLGPEKGGDVILRSMAITTIDINEPLEEQVEREEEEEPEGEVGDLSEDSAEPGGTSAEAGTQPPAEEMSPQNAPKTAPKSIKLKAYFKSENYWRRFAARTESHENETKKELHRFFGDQKAEVLRRIDPQGHAKLIGLTAGMGVKKAREIIAKSGRVQSYLFDMAKADHEILGLMLPRIVACHDDFRRRMLAKCNPDRKNITSKSAVNYVGQKLDKGRLLGINQTTRDKLQTTLQDGYVKGESIDELAKRVESVYSEAAGYRSDMIARTEIIAASNAGSLDGMKESGVVEEKEWLTAGDERVRETHAEANGQVVKLGAKFKVGDSEMEYPGDPEGDADETINCLLPGNKVRGEFIAGSKSCYSGKAFEITTASGKRFSVTANHPVLTDGGFVPAHNLRKGFNLIAYRSEIGDGLMQNADKKNVPSLIEDVFDALRPGAIFKRKVVGHYFHGDGKFMQGEVGIVRADRPLQIGLNIPSLQQNVNVPLMDSDSQKPLPVGKSSADSDLNGISGITTGNPGCGALAPNPSRIGLDLGPLGRLGLGPAPHDNPPLSEIAVKSDAHNSGAVADRLKRFAGLIALDQIIEIRQFDFSGHVYDLQGIDGLIIAEDIFVSNCRCTEIPVVGDEAQAPDEEGEANE